MAVSRKDSRGYALYKNEFERKNKKGYEYRWWDPYTGKHRSISAPTLKELRKREQEVLRDRIDGIKSDSDITLNDYYRIWKNLKTGLKDDTRENYMYMYERFVKDSLGKKPLCKLKYSDVVSFYTQLVQKRQLSVSTLDTLHTVIHPVLDMAVNDDVIRRNVSDGALKDLKAEDKKKAREEQEAKQREQAAKNAKKAKKQQPAAPQFSTYPKMLLEVLDWLTEQNATQGSEYYHCLNLDKVAAMGQSCGGAQVLAVAYDPRIKTCVMLNTGIGDMEMMGATKECLKNLHTPMFYMIGGPADIAYANAQKDYERIADNIPVVMLNSKDGHSGTYYEKYGGNYAKAVVKWLDWQLKGCVGQSALFLDDEYLKMKFPEWQGVRKNF